MSRFVAGGLRFQAVSIGSGLPPLATPRELEVHSIFRSALNLRLDDSDLLATMTGPGGAAYPNAICLQGMEDFRDWPLGKGSASCRQ